MDIKDLLTRGVVEIIEKEHLQKRLEKGEKLRIKFGIDPTSSDLHLGNAVGLRKLAAFQILGHQIIFIIGDFTARIGDPAERENARKPLSEEEIKKNLAKYLRQAGKIIEIEKTEVYYNSSWFEKGGARLLMELASKQTVSQVLERKDFQKRLSGGGDVALQETIYPALQGYDSVQVKADLEIGGYDQRLNMLVGRAIQKKYNQPAQDVMMLKLLIGLDGKEKMSKSLGNYIAVEDSPADMFGKVMSIPDSQIIPYFELCTDLEEKALAIVKKELEGGKNPRDIKARLAKLIVTIYDSAEAAELAEKEFTRVFRAKGVPTKMPEKEVSKEENIIDLIVNAGLATSRSEARRLVEQGGVRLAGNVINDPNQKVKILVGQVLQVGKLKFVKLKVKE